MADVPDNAPSQCPGTESTQAGKDSACQGCPNQSLCSSGQSKIPLRDREPEIIDGIRRRLAGIRYCLLVLSGKGGVGKSTLTVCLARGLSRRSRWWNSKDSSNLGPLDDENRSNPFEDNEDLCYRVGVLDLDLCGPSLPCLFGCLDQKVHQSHAGWSPVYVSDNLALMSVGLLLPNPDQAIIWRGPRKNALIRQLLTEVCWREDCDVGDQPSGTTVDLLLIDTPPGTSDEHLSVVQYLQAAGCLTGCLVVTTPQEVALSSVRKEIDFCRKLGVPIVGIVENMTEFICPICQYAGLLFPPTTGGAASLQAKVSPSSELSDLQAFGDIASLPGQVIGRLPMDPRLTQILDEGLCPFELADEQREISEVNKSARSLSPSDAILVAYNQLIDNLVDVLRNHFQPINASP